MRAVEVDEVKPKGDSGQTLVEFALILFLLLAILFGIVEFGRLWYYSNHLSNSVRAAARYGAVLPASSVDNVNALIKTYAETEITSYVNATPGSDLIVTSEIIDQETHLPKKSGNPVRGDTVEVTATLNFTVLAGSIIPFFNNSNPHPIIRTATMRYESGL